MLADLGHAPPAPGPIGPFEVRPHAQRQIDLACARVRVFVHHLGRDLAWDFYVEMDAVDFTALLKGTLDVERAAGEGRIRVGGDPSMFANLMAVMQPPAQA